MNCPIIAIANQKGGVGKTTTTINLAQAWTILRDQDRVLIVDFDPQGNATQASGIKLESVNASVSDLIRDRSFKSEGAIYKGQQLDIIAATPLLAQVEREMVGMTNSELRLAQRLRELRGSYAAIIIDTPPTFGPLMNSALNAADSVIIPVDSGVFALQGIKSLLGEIEEIRSGTNPRLQVLGYLLTLFDQTCITQEVLDSLISSFGDQVFETHIRRSVKLREAPALGKAIFHHAPGTPAARDYILFAQEVLNRIEAERTRARIQSPYSNSGSVLGGVR